MGGRVGHDDRKHPWLKFYLADFARDRAVLGCSYAARGLWIGMLWLMHEAEPYGQLRGSDGQPLDAAALASLTGGRPREVTRLLDELERQAVFSRTGEGVIYCRRLVRDRASAVHARAVGELGGNPALVPRAPGVGRNGGRFRTDNNPQLRRTIFDRSQGRCQICGKGLTFSAVRTDTNAVLDSMQIARDHRRNDPGPDGTANLIAVCRRCNRLRDQWPALLPAVAEAAQEGGFAAFAEQSAAGNVYPIGRSQSRIPVIPQSPESRVQKRERESQEDSSIPPPSSNRRECDSRETGTSAAATARSITPPVRADCAPVRRPSFMRSEFVTVDSEGEETCGGWILRLVFPKLLDAAGMSPNPPNGDEPLLRWLAAGLDFEDEILAIVKSAAARPGYQPPASLRYFDRSMQALIRRRAHA